MCAALLHSVIYALMRLYVVREVGVLAFPKP
jgi:hypothetical protein